MSRRDNQPPISTCIQQQTRYHPTHRGQNFLILIDAHSHPDRRATEEFAKPEDLQGQLDLNDELAAEAAQRRRDRLHWQRKVAELEAQLVGEPERLREGYRVCADRLEIVGLLYLWPASN